MDTDFAGRAGRNWIRVLSRNHWYDLIDAYLYWFDEANETRLKRVDSIRSGRMNGYFYSIYGMNYTKDAALAVDIARVQRVHGDGLHRRLLRRAAPGGAPLRRVQRPAHASGAQQRPHLAALQGVAQCPLPSMAPGSPRYRSRRGSRCGTRFLQVSTSIYLPVLLILHFCHESLACLKNQYGIEVDTSPSPPRGKCY